MLNVEKQHAVDEEYSHNVNKSLRSLLIFLILILPACTAISSKKIEGVNAGEVGVVYYMPKKDVRVVVNVSKNPGDLPIIEISTGPSYADMKHGYKLKSTRNLLAENTLDIGVSKAGLLTKTNVKSESKVSESLLNLADSAAFVAKNMSVVAQSAAENNRKAKCLTGTFTKIIDLSADINETKYIDLTDVENETTDNSDGPNSCRSKSGEADKECIVFVNVKKLDTSLTKNHLQTGIAKLNGSSGVYYRTEEPYRIDVEFHGQDRRVYTSSKVVMSPSKSSNHFVPIDRTFFADSDAKMSFEEGVLTGYNPATKSEFVELLGLPATIIAQYFTAVSAILGKKDSLAEAEQKRLQSELALQLSKLDFEKCRLAIRAKDASDIETECK